MTLDELRIVAVQSEQILQSEAFKAMVPRLRDEYTRSWYQAKTTQAREECWIACRALDDIVRAIAKPIQDYKVAEATANRNRTERMTGEPA